MFGTVCSCAVSRLAMTALLRLRTSPAAIYFFQNGFQYIV